MNSIARRLGFAVSARSALERREVLSFTTFSSYLWIFFADVATENIVDDHVTDLQDDLGLFFETVDTRDLQLSRLVSSAQHHPTFHFIDDIDDESDMRLLAFSKHCTNAEQLAQAIYTYYKTHVDFADVFEEWYKENK